MKHRETQSNRERRSTEGALDLAPCVSLLFHSVVLCVKKYFPRPGLQAKFPFSSREKRVGDEVFFKFIFLLITCFTVISCTRPLPSKVEDALQKAGDNRAQLEQVIEHYKNDKEKLKAAYFLIENMTQYYSYRSNKLTSYENYFYQIDSIQKFTGSLKNSERDSLLEEYKKRYGEIDKSALQLVSDIKNIKAGYLVQNIDFAFYVWKNMPWAKHISFDEFCEYILPYRVGDEHLTYWRNYLYKKYSWLREQISDSTDSFKAADELNNSIQDYFTLDLTFSVLPFHPGLDELIRARRGGCVNAVDYILYCNRALGIPVACDHVPQWANRSQGHSWQTVLSAKGKMVSFYADGILGFTGGTEYKAPKVFRNTYAMQENLPASIEEDSASIPKEFRSKNFKDVTREYFSVFNVKVNIERELPYLPTLAYLCVFNNSDWIPVGWGKITGKKVVFKDMAGNITYLPVICDNHQIIPVAPSFLLRKNGTIIQFKPNEHELQTLILKRKYPLFKRIEMFVNRMTGGRFEGANRADFSDAEIIYQIKNTPDIVFNDITFKTPRNFRYIRYVGPENAYGNVAEIEVYAKDKKLEGQPIGIEGKEDNPISKVFDNDKLSYYEADNPDGTWVGLDLHSRQQVTKIRFIPRNDQNNIEPGLDYELFYWNSGWISLGRAIARSNQLVFEDAPTNALFLLHCHSGGKEERIFTYEHGYQVWW